MLSLIGYTISYILPVKLFGFLEFLIIFFGLNSLNELIQDLRKKKKNKSEKSQQTSTSEQVEMIQLEPVKFNCLNKRKKMSCSLLG
jgi:hypothetical protein